MRGGGNVRVRPDGTELEIYSRGTRNDYDLAIDPYLNLFARGNTNDGGGFDIRLYHFVAGATFGYPTLFRNFNDEVVPPLADYGTGSGTGMLYVHDSALPAPYGNTLYSVDWGKNAVFRHDAAAEGRHVLRHAGGIHHRAQAERHGHRRQLARCTWRAGRAASSDTGARRSAGSPASPTSKRRRRRRSIWRPRPTSDSWSWSDPRTS